MCINNSFYILILKQVINAGFIFNTKHTYDTFFNKQLYESAKEILLISKSKLYFTTKQKLVKLSQQQQKDTYYLLYSKQKNSKAYLMNMLKSLKSYLFSAQPQSQSPSQPQQLPNLQIQLSQKQKVHKVIRWKDGTVYIGECKNTVMQGIGKLIFPNGDFYQGQFKDNNFNGFGQYSSQSTLSEGQWKNGLKHGHIKQQNQDNSNFQGKYENGLKQGMGFLQWPDGSFYQGMFKRDFMEGPGKMVYGHGGCLEGQWRENYMCGLGREVQENGNVYIGGFQGSLKHGKGLLIEKQRKIQGVWIEGMIIGAAIVQHNNGTVINVKLVEDNLVEIDDNQYQKIVSSMTVTEE